MWVYTTVAAGPNQLRRVNELAKDDYEWLGISPNGKVWMRVEESDHRVTTRGNRRITSTGDPRVMVSGHGS